MKKILHGIRAVAPAAFKRKMYRAGLFFGSSLYRSFPSMPGTLQYLRDWGYQSAAAIDVGAYHGEWTKMFKGIFPQSKVLLVEGQLDKRPILDAYCRTTEGVRAASALLGAEDGKKVTFAEMETGSAVFEEASSRARTHVEKELLTLDSLLIDHADFSRADFLKLDVQGYEIEVLKGATQLLDHVQFALMETSLIPINTSCPLIGEVIGFMGSRDFRLLDFCSQIRRRDGSLWQTDLLFVKNSSPWVPKPTLARNPVETKILPGISEA